MRRFSIWMLALAGIAHAQFTAAPGSPYPAGSAPNAVVTADFNGDGIPDLAIADFSGGNVTVLLGVRGGGFTKAGGSTAIQGSEPVALAAFACGTQMCLAVANQGASDIVILTGDGTGTFTQALSGPLALNGPPSAIAVATANSTVWIAATVLTSPQGQVAVFSGNGTNPFLPVTSKPFTVGQYPSAVAMADVNGDKLPDIVVVNKIDDTIDVLLAVSGGSFQQPSLISLIPAGVPQPVTPTAYPDAVAIADFNGDLKPDLAVANEGADSVTILLGDGTGKFAPVPESSPTSVGSTPFALVSADFNGDGKPDLAVANQGSNTVTVLLGNGAAGFIATAYDPFTPASGSPYPAGATPVSLAAADFNGDGTIDLAVANENANTATVLLNNLYIPAVMVSAASYTMPVAIASIVSIFGTAMASAPVSATNPVALPTVLGQTGAVITYSSGAQELLPLFYVSAGQIDALIPADAVAGAATVTVYNGAVSQTGSVLLAQTAPGLFSANGTSQGVAAAQYVAYPYYAITNVFECVTGAGSCAPIPLNVAASGGNAQLVLYGTGIRNSPLPVTVSIGGTALTANFVGAAPNNPGEDQVNVALPVNLPAGLVTVTVTAGGITSNAVTIFIQ